MSHILEFDSIRLSFKSKLILSDIFMRCETGKIVGLLGRNGQGKTCLLNIVYGELPAQEKSIRFDQVHVNDAFRRPKLLMYLPQFSFIPKHLTLNRIFNDFNLDFRQLEFRFPEFQFKQNEKFRTFSGGQQRFIETYIVIKSESQFVLLDEPFTNLMPIQIEKIIQLLLDEKENKGFIITDHLYNHIIDVSDNLYLLVDGKTHRISNLSEIEHLGYVNF